MGAGGAEESSQGMVGAGVISVPDYRQIGTGQERLVRHVLNGTEEGREWLCQQPLDLLALRCLDRCCQVYCSKLTAKWAGSCCSLPSHTGCLGECTLHQPSFPAAESPLCPQQQVLSGLTAQLGASSCLQCPFMGPWPLRVNLGRELTTCGLFSVL